MTRVKLPQVLRRCEVCKKRFYVPPYRIKWGYGRYCSVPCQIKGRTSTLWDRFQKYLSEPTATGCILWTGGVNNNGYGGIGEGGKSRKQLLVHRVAYRFSFGPIPDGLEVCHNCPGGDNPRCVNPAHLWLGTHAENMADRVAKGTSFKGEANHLAKLSNADVLQIRSRRANEKPRPTYRQMSEEYGVAESLICRIVKGQIWKHLL